MAVGEAFPEDDLPGFVFKELMCLVIDFFVILEGIFSWLLIRISQENNSHLDFLISGMTGHQRVRCTATCFHSNRHFHLTFNSLCPLSLFLLSLICLWPLLLLLLCLLPLCPLPSLPLPLFSPCSLSVPFLSLIPLHLHPLDVTSCIPKLPLCRCVYGDFYLPGILSCFQEMVIKHFIVMF